MKQNLPLPSDLLKELAGKVIDAIDSLAVSAFNVALNEMVDYHIFLLEAYATKSDDGTPFSYAEIEGNWFGGPHQQWIREYGRVFERAASRIGQETEFVTTLVHVPIRLLGKRAQKLSSPVIASILDLGSIMAARLEDWLTRRVSIENVSGQSASPRLTLTGSDKAAFADVISDFVGAWEGVLQHVGSLYSWKEVRGEPLDIQWNRLAMSWPLLQHHLRNTAYFLTVAVWNEDEVGADYFRDSLVRWPEVFRFELADAYYSPYARLLFPDLFFLKWDEVKTKLNEIEATDLDRGADPFALETTVLRGAHDDTIFLTSAVLLRWFIEQKQSTNIAAITASRLLGRELVDPEDLTTPNEIGFRPLFFEVLRLNVGEMQSNKKSYGAFLDGLVSSLDQMSERRVVPGRIFTPSTIHGRHDLLLSFAIMLLLKTPDEGDENVVARLADLIFGDGRLPQGDRSLSHLLQFLGQLAETPKKNIEPIYRALSVLLPDTNYKKRIANLENILNSCIGTIKEYRTNKIRSLPIDNEILDRTTQTVESAITNSPFELAVFHDFLIEKIQTDLSVPIVDRIVFRGIAKGVFTKPQMDFSWGELDKMFLDSVRNFMSRYIWQSFWDKPRNVVRLTSNPGMAEFWREIAPYASQVGHSAALLLKNSSQRRSITEWLYDSKKSEGLHVQRKPKVDRGGGAYVASVEGIDVYFGGLNSGNAFLFSSQKLKAVRYVPIKGDRILELILESEDDPWKMSLRAKFAQTVEWDETPIFEFQDARDKNSLSP